MLRGVQSDSVLTMSQMDGGITSQMGRAVGGSPSECGGLKATVDRLNGIVYTSPQLKIDSELLD